MKLQPGLRTLWAAVIFALVIILLIGVESCRRNRRDARASRYRDLYIMQLHNQPMTIDERVELRDLSQELGYSASR